MSFLVPGVPGEGQLWWVELHRLTSSDPCSNVFEKVTATRHS
jgi:hypothetical protein